MLKEILKNEWISPNGKWKVSAEIREIGAIIVSNINVFSSVREGVWKNENNNEKLPKYVATELQKAKDHAHIQTIKEMTITTVD